MQNLVFYKIVIKEIFSKYSDKATYAVYEWLQKCIERVLRKLHNKVLIRKFNSQDKSPR